MVATFLVSVAALIVAVLGCAWVKPAVSGVDSRSRTDKDWARDEVSADHVVRPQER